MLAASTKPELSTTECKHALQPEFCSDISFREVFMVRTIMRGATIVILVIVVILIIAKVTLLHIGG